jgi:hypothetical protein
MLNMTDFVILEPGALWPWTLAATLEGAAAKLGALMLEDPRRWAAAGVLPYDTYAAEHDARYLSEPTRVIAEEEWEEALGCLPPLNWHTTADGVNVFFMSEFMSGPITTQYGRRNGAYRLKYVRYGDASTYLKARHF